MPGTSGIELAQGIRERYPDLPVVLTSGYSHVLAQHGTFGFELRVFEENVWGPRRGRISFTGDVAERYRNIAVSVGFWH